MKKRVAAALLWFCAAWYAGAMVAYFLGVSVALGPILGTAAAAIVAGDPRGLIWGRPTSRTSSTAKPSTQPSAQPTA